MMRDSSANFYRGGVDKYRDVGLNLSTNWRFAMNGEAKKTRIAVPQIATKNKVENFENHEIRIAFNEKKGKLYFCVPDVVTALRDGKDAKDYIKKLRKRDPELNAKWSKIIKFIPFQTIGGRQPIKFAEHENLLRILQKVHSPKMEEFEEWVAQKVEEAQ